MGSFVATLPQMTFFLLLIPALTIVLRLIFSRHPLKQRVETPHTRKADEAVNYSPIPLYTLWTREAWQFTEGVRQVGFEVHWCSCEGLPAHHLSTPSLTLVRATVKLPFLWWMLKFIKFSSQNTFKTEEKQLLLPIYTFFPWLTHGTK